MKIVGIESWKFRTQLFSSIRKDISTKPCGESLYSCSKTYLIADCRCKVSQNHIDPHGREKVFHHHEMCARDLLHDQCKAEVHLCDGPEIRYTGIFSFILFKLNPKYDNKFSCGKSKLTLISLYFVDRACRCIFLPITNLTHFFMYLRVFISALYLFRTSQCSSSGDRILLIHNLV
jgi:hypothetical protein